MKTLTDVVEHALVLTGYDTLRIAQEDVPVETGTLRRSGTVTIGEPPNPQECYQMALIGQESPLRGKKLSDKKKSVFVSYSTPYAVFLHETKGWRGRLKPTARWKWLERALPKAWKRFRKHLQRAEAKAKWWAK